MTIRTFDRHFDFDTPVNIDWKYRVKRLLLPFYDLFYDFILRVNRPHSTPGKKYRLAVCAIFKDEGLFMREWIEYNRIIGVEHFFLYNNFSSDNYREILAPYIEQGLVTLIEWPVEKGQFPAYEHFWQNYRMEAQWVTFIDLDEFICPFHETSVVQWLEKFKHNPSVLVYWKMFGTSGQLDHDFSRSVGEQYTVCWDKIDNVGKVILNTDWEFTRIYHHTINAKIRFLGRYWSVPTKNEFGKYIQWDNIHRTDRKGEFTIQMNHYWSKSFRQFYIGKVLRGDVNNFDRNLDLLYWFEERCTSADHKIFRFLIRLKLALGLDKDNG